MQLIDFAIRRRVTVVMCTVAIALFGLVSLTRLKVNLLPDLSYPTITIRTELPGAAPLEIETLVTRPVEEAVSIIRNVRQVRSVSRSGQSDVTLEFVWGTDMDLAGIDVREKLDLLQLPIEAKRPLLLRFDPSSEPVLRLAFLDKAESTRDEGVERLKVLRRFAEDRLKPDLEAVEGSAAVKVSGGYEDEVRVFVDQQKLAQLGLSIDTVTSRIRAENVNLSGGRLEQGTQRFLVRTLNEFESIEQMADAIVANREGKPVYLKDVATVTRGYKDREAITRIDGREAIELAVYKEGDANTVQLAAGVKQRLDALGKTLPDGTEVRTVYDQSTFIAAAIGEVKSAALIGGLLAILVLYAFLRDARATLISSIAIPVSVLGTFVLMYAFDLSLNIMSLGGIALAVGMLVDNAVVVLESIVRKQEHGMERREAARKGTAEVAMAVTAATLTSVAVFFPMVFITGVAGQLFRDQSLTVTFALSFSLVVALTLVPMLAAGTEPRAAAEPGIAPRAPRRYEAWLARIAAWAGTGFGYIARAFALVLSPLVRVTQSVNRWADDHYPGAIGWALAHPGRTIGSAVALFVFTVAVILPRLGTELIPQMSQGEFNVDLRLPPGAPLEQTDRVVKATQQASAGLGNVALAYSVAGTGNRLDANPVDAGENTGRVSITLQKGARRADEEKAMDGMRTSLDDLPGVQYRFSRPALFSMSTPLEVVVSGYDLDRLQAAAEQVRAKMLADPRFSDVKTTVEAGKPGNPDRVRPGARGPARPRGPRHRRPARLERARRRRHPLQAARQADRRAGAQRGQPGRLDRGSAQPDRQPGCRAPGDVERSGRRAAGRRPGRGPPHRPGTRGRGLGQPRGGRPRLGGRGPAADRRQHAVAGRHGRVPVRPERGDDRLVPLAAVRAAARDLPRLPRHGVPVRVADTPVRDPAHHSTRGDRCGVGLVAHQYDAERRGLHRPDHAGRHRGQPVDRADRRREPGARAWHDEGRGHRRGGAAAPATHPDHQADDDPRPVADGTRPRRRRRGAGADGDHGHRRRAAHDVPHAARDPGRLFGARPQGLSGPRRRGRRGGRGPTRHKLRHAMRHTRLALERPITTVMVALAVLAVGLISGRLLRLEAMPDITFPGMQVVIPYPGSTPEEIEQLIVRPVEEALATLSGVEEIRASAQSDQAQFQILFDWDRDANAAAFDVRTKLDSIRAQLPAGADRLLMFAFNASDQAIVIIRISADQDLTDQYEMLEKYLQRPLQRLEGVARVELEGVQPREVRVLVDPNRLAAYGVDVRSLRTLLEASNFSVSAGEITENGARLTVRPIGEFNDLQDVRDIVISPGVRVGDVARIELVAPELPIGRRMDGRPAVGIDVFKTTEGNVVDVADRVIAAVNEARKIPQLQGIQILVVENQAEGIRQSLRELRNAGIVGAVLSFTMLLFFLRHLPTTLIVSLAVPASLLVTLGAMYFLGFSLNILTMMGMLLAVGMLVDNSVVITESIFRHRQLNPGRPLEATLAGVKEVGVATLAGTFSTTIVFLPLVFGEKNQMSIFLVHVAVPIVVAMLASLVVAQTLIPMLAARMPPPPPVAAGSWFGRLQDRYVRSLDWSLGHRKTMGLITLLILLSPVPLFMLKLAKVDPFPQEASRTLMLNYHLDGSYPMPQVEEAVRRVEAYLEANKEKFEIDTFYSVWMNDEAHTRLYLKPKGEAQAAGAGDHGRRPCRRARDHHRQAEFPVRRFRRRIDLVHAAARRGVHRAARRDITRSGPPAVLGTRASKPCAPRRAPASRRCRSSSIATARPSSDSRPRRSP